MTDRHADDPHEGLREFFEALPHAVILYAGAIGAVSVAAIFVRVAANVFFNI